MCLRGPERRHGRFCCCSAWIGMHLSGIFSLGLTVFYLWLMVKMIDADEFNWVIIIWLALGTIRVIFWLIMCLDSLYRRKMFAYALIGTTLIEAGIYIVNQFIIFTDKDDFCGRVYLVYYMVTEWDIDCDWAITLFEIMQSMSLTFYVYASIGAFDHYHHGFKNPTLEIREFERIKALDD